MPATPRKTGLREIFLIYLRLGCLSFGGPIAHMAYYRDEFVRRRKWLDDKLCPDWPRLAIALLAAVLALCLPGLLLLVGLLPFWDRIRLKHWTQAGLTGANAAVVGLLLAALIDPVWTHGIRSLIDFGIGLIAFFALYKFKAPAWAVVLGCGIAGYVIF